MDTPAAPPAMTSVDAASALSANTVTSPSRTNDGENGHNMANWTKLSLDLATPSRSIPGSHLMFSQSTTARQREVGRREEGVEGDGTALPKSILTKRPHALSLLPPPQLQRGLSSSLLSPAATRKSNTADSTAPLTSPDSTLPEGLLPLSSTAAVADLSTAPASAAGPPAIAMGTDASIHGHPLSVQLIISQSSATVTAASERVPMPSVIDSAGESSALPAMPTALPENAAVTVGKSFMDADDAKCVAESDGSTGSGSSASHPPRCGTGDPLDGQAETVPSFEQPSVFSSDVLPATWTEPPPSPSHTSLDTSEKRGTEPSNVPRSSLCASSSPLVPLLCESPGGLPSALCVALGEQPRNDERLSGTSDGGSGKMEEAGSSSDEGDCWGGPRRPHHSPTHYSGEIVERDEAHNEVGVRRSRNTRERSRRRRRLRSHQHRRPTRELDTDDFHTSPPHGSGHQPHQGHSSVRGSFQLFTAALGTGLTFMADAAASELPQQVAVHPHASAFSPTSTRAHRAHMRLRTAAPSLIQVDALRSTPSLEIPSTRSSLLSSPASLSAASLSLAAVAAQDRQRAGGVHNDALSTERHRSSGEPLLSGWPDTIFPICEDEDESAASPEGEALQLFTQARQQQGQEGGAWAEGDVVGKTTDIVITTREISLSPPLATAAHVREATAVAVALPPLHADEYLGGARAETLASASASRLLSPPAVAMTSGAMFPSTGALATAAPTFSTVVLPTRVHLPPPAPLISALAASSLPPRPAPRPQPPTLSSAVAARLPLPVAEKQQAADAPDGNDAERAVAASTSAVFVESDAVPVAPYPLPTLPVLSVPATTATAAGAVVDSNGETHGDADLAALLYTSLPASPGGGRASIETVGSILTLKSGAAGYNRLWMSGTSSSAILGQERLSMAQFGDRVVSSEGGSQHGSDADNSRRRSGEREEGTRTLQLYPGAHGRHGCSDSGSSYYYSYSYSYKTGDTIGSTMRGTRSSITAAALRAHDERGRTVTVGTAAVPCTEPVKLIGYEEVTPVAGGRSGVLGCLRFGCKNVTGGVRTSRTEVHRLCYRAEDTPRDHLIGLSFMHAGCHQSPAEGEGSAASPVAITGNEGANSANGGEGKVEEQRGAGEMKSSGTTGSEGNSPSHGLGGTTETPHSSEHVTGEGVGEVETYASRRGSISSIVDSEAPFCNRDDTLVPPHSGSKETDEGDDGFYTPCEEAEAVRAAAAAAAEVAVQENAPPLDVIDQTALSSSASALCAELAVGVGENTATSLLAHRETEVDGANASEDAGILRSDGCALGSDRSAPSSATDATKTHHSENSGAGRARGGGGEEERGESMATTAVSEYHGLLALLMYTEELPRLRAWDAHPPVAASTDRSHQVQEAEKLKMKCNEEAIAAAEAAEQAFRQTVQELLVRPPRQCIFVEVHGLRSWCLAVLCPQQVPMDGLASGATTVLGEEWRGAWSISAQAAAPIIEDPKWIDVRLAMYVHESADERLLAAGSVFSLPSNLEALRRCLGCGGSSDDTVESTSTGGYGRDSWSDLLVFQLLENASEGAAEGGQPEEGRMHASLLIPSAEDTAGHSSGGGGALSRRVLECGVAGSSLLGSLGGAGVLYVKLEERCERWAPMTDEYVRAATIRASELASSPETRAYSPVNDAAAAVITEDKAEDLTTSSQLDEGDAGQSSMKWQTEPLSLPSSLPLSVETGSSHSLAGVAKAVRAGSHRSIGSTADMGSVYARAADGSGAHEHAEVMGTRLEVCWRPLAVSSPLLPADLCQLQSNQPPLLTALETTAEAAANPTACSGKPLPQLPCRLRWAQEPPPQALSADQDLSSWSLLGTAIQNYERVCRGAATGAVSAVSADDRAVGKAASYTPSRPLTVVWDTIPSHLIAGNDRALEMQEANAAAAAAAAPPHRWYDGRRSPGGHGIEALTVCSVVVRCAAAVLFAHAVADARGSGGCPLTSISVTGGCDGVVVEQTASGEGDDTLGTPVAHRAPVMRYNISFHAVLTHDSASSLLFTVHGVASPAEVFGFAAWAPFDTAPATRVPNHHHYHGGDAGVGCCGVMDVWLPLFAPASANAAPLATVSAQQREAAPAGIFPAALSSLNTGHHHSTTGLLPVGWLHCDVETVFLPSLNEAAVHQLWNGPQRSLSSIAAAAGGETEHDECCMGHGIRVDDDTLVDFSVMEGAGLRPLVTKFGMPLSPTPLRWDDSSSWGNNETCANVYCEVLALQQQRQQRTSHRVPGLAPHVAGVFSAASSSLAARVAAYGPHISGYHRIAAGDSDLDVMRFASELAGQGRAAHCAPLDVSGEESGERDAYATWTVNSVMGSTEANAVLPVTASDAQTNHPRWRHVFRCGLASLSALHLRVFDLCQHRLGGDSEANPQTAECSSMQAQRSGASGKRAILLGTATVSSWLLRRLLCRPSGEGCAWLPLLWSPSAAAEPIAASAAISGKGCLHSRFVPAVCNGFVLVEWRRLPQTTAMVRSRWTRELSSWCASVTRRSLNSNGCHTTGSAMRIISSIKAFKKPHEFPLSWYQPIVSPRTDSSAAAAIPVAYSRQPGWMVNPEVVPWLRIHELRLQWPWLQHLLCMHGGQVRLSLRYPTAQGETRLLAQCLLVPLCALAGPLTNSVGVGRSSRVNLREARDTAGVYGVVLSAAPSYNATPSPKAVALAEAALCLPASPFVEVQVWWYPRDSADTAAANRSEVPPRFIGRGKWHFPAHEATEGVRGLVAGEDRGAFDETLNAQPTPGCATGLVGLSNEAKEGGSSVGRSLLPTALHSFFTPHEVELRVAPVHSTGFPQHVGGGVLAWRLMSLPRLTCAGWGEVPPTMPPLQPESLPCVAGSCGDFSRPLRSPSAEVPTSSWVWPDVGTPAVVQVEVCNMICFDHTDGPCIDAAQAAPAVQIAVSGTTCDGSSRETLSDESAPVAEARCWVYPGDTPPPDAPRVGYTFFPVYDAATGGVSTWSNPGGDQQQQQQSLAAAGGPRKSAACSAMPDAGARRSPTVEVQWPSRRFGWIDDAPPSLSVWVMTRSPFSSGAGAPDDMAAAAEGRERVWGAVRLLGLDAFTSTSGMLWLPLFQSYAAPALAAEAPRCTDAVKDMTENSSSGSGAGQHCGAVSPLPLPSTVERVHCGANLTAPPQSALPYSDAADPLMTAAAPSAAVMVRHVGFVSVRYAHNMQRRAAVAVTKPLGTAPRALLVRVGPLHRRFPVRGTARYPLSSPSSPSPSESYTPLSDAALPHRNEAGIAFAVANSTAGAAAAAVSVKASGAADVLLGFEAHQVTVHVLDAGSGADGLGEASTSGRVTVFPLPQRDVGDGGSRQLRVQARVGTSAAMATNTMYIDTDGDGETPESAQWVPLVVRHRSHDARGVGYDSEGEKVVAEILVQWRVVDLSAAAAPSRLTFSPVPLQRLVREYCGGGGASCSYTVSSALSAAAQLRQSPSRQSYAEVQQRARCLELLGRGPIGQGTATTDLVSRALSRVLRTIQPRRHRCAYLTLDRFLLQCSACQRLAWASLQRGMTASPQEILESGGHDGATSTPIRFRLEVQLRWPTEWSAVWHRTVSPSPRRVPLAVGSDMGASSTPAAASARATAGLLSLNAWMDSGEGVFAESSSPATPGAAVADEAAACASEERLLSCASLPPLCLALPSAQDIEHVLGEPGLATRFDLTFALFAVLPWQRDNAFPEAKVSDVCVGTGRTPMAFSRSVQFGLTTLFPSVSSASSDVAPCVDTADADTKDSAASMPVLLRWRARVTDSLPVPPPASSVLHMPPKVRDLAADSGKNVRDGATRCDGQMPSWSFSSSATTSSAEKDAGIKGDEHTRLTGITAVPLLPRTPALARVTVTRIELCGVDVSLARGSAQRHLRPLPPATVTVMVADVTNATTAPTGRRGSATIAPSTVHQLLPRLLPLRPTAASSPMRTTSAPSLPTSQRSQTQRFPPPLPQRYTWGTDVCLVAPVSQLLFYISVPDIAVRSARGEEAWLPPRCPSSEVEPQDGDAQSVDAHWQSGPANQLDVVGKAAYTLDLLSQVEGVQPPCANGRFVPATRTTGDTHDAVLEVESVVHDCWLGRLWVQVDITAADLLMRDAASTFFTSRMTLSVQRCGGFAVGDVRLTCRAEETYSRLRERAALLCQQRGRVPRRLRQQVKEIRQIRRQLRQGQGQQRDGVLADHTASSTAAVVRLTSTWGEQGTDASLTFTSDPFALPTATEFVRQGHGAATPPTSMRTPLLCFSLDINTAQMTDDATATVRLELCQASGGVAVAAGQMVLPLRSACALWREGAWQPPVSAVTSPMSMRVNLQPCATSGMHTPLIRPVTPSAGAADVAATWALSPVRGDTWLTCIYVKPTPPAVGAATPPRQLLLRWVYCFEATAYPETEHAVDIPLRLRPSLTTSDHEGEGAQMPHAGHRLGDSVPLYWSGAAMQLPRIGPVGATLKRVELLEVTPVSCTHHLVSGGEAGMAQPSPLQSGLPMRDACVTTQLAAHVWTVADELCLEARRRQAQDSGDDALIWLTCEGASTTSSRRCRFTYEVLLGLYTSNSLAMCAAQILEHRRVRVTGAEKPIAPLEAARQRPRSPSPTGVNALSSRGAARFIKVDESLSPPPAPYARSHASTRSAGGVVVSGGAASDGGVVMRALTFRCGGAALAPLAMGQVDTVTCCVVAVQGRVARGAVDSAAASIVVLNAGNATSLLQEGLSTEGLPHATTTSLPPLAPVQLTAAWLPTPGLPRSTAAASCVIAESASAGSNYSPQEERLQKVGGALLRVALPLVPPDVVLAAVGDGEPGDIGSDIDVGMRTMLEEEQFRIEVEVQGRRCGTDVDEAAATARYASAPFCASDILRSARSNSKRNSIGSSADTTAAVAGGDSSLCVSPSQWPSTLAMHLVSAPMADGTTGSGAHERSEKEREAGPLPPRMAPTATMEVTWALDMLGLLRTSACAAGVVLTSAKCACHRADRDAGGGAEDKDAVFGSLARVSDDTDDDDADVGGMGMRQLEAYSAWSDFLAAQHSMEEMRTAEAELRHWCCTIVGVEVSGLELPSWCSTGADAQDEVYNAALCPSLLAQVMLPIRAPTTAAVADAEWQPHQGTEGTGCHHGGRLRTKGGLVIGVARNAVTRMERGGCLDMETAATSCQSAVAAGDACGVRSVAPVNSSSSLPRCHRYTATFTPLSWTMAVTDMIDQTVAAAEHREMTQSTAATVSEAPVAGLTVWQLLARASVSSSSARNNVNNSHSTAENVTQIVYSLGSTQLARLLHEGALYLVQVIARWCDDVYTAEERDTLLKAAALYPTQWMPLAPTTPIMDGTQGKACVRLKCAYSYHGPKLRPPRSLAMELPPRITAPGALADAVCCAQLDHVQLTCTSSDGAEATAAASGPQRHNVAGATAAWLSRLMLVMRVHVITESAVDGTVAHSRNMAQWHTRLALMPCSSVPPITKAESERDTVASSAPAGSSATPQSTLVPTVPVQVTVAQSAVKGVDGAAESPRKGGDGGDWRAAVPITASVAPSSTIEVVSLRPTTRFFSWQPPSPAETMERCKVAQTSAGVPAACAVETTTTTLVEMALLLPDEKAREEESASVSSLGCLSEGSSGTIAGTVVGRGQVRLGCSRSNEVVWNAAEDRLESGWRLCAPLSVRFPVTTEAALPRREYGAPICASAPEAGEKGEAQPSLMFSFDLLLFTAPSMAQVAALHACRARRAEKLRRSLSVLQRIETALLASETSHYHHDQAHELKGTGVIAAGEPRMTLSQLSHTWMSRRPYLLLRVPPTMIRVDTFAVLDSVPSTERRATTLSAGSNGEGGATQPCQTLWTMPRGRMSQLVSSYSVADDAPCPSRDYSGGGLSGGTNRSSVPAEVQAWLVDGHSGEVRVPVWTLLTNDPPAPRGTGDAATRTHSPASSLASHLHAGRAILREVQRLRLDWRSNYKDARQQSVSLLAALAGLVGGAVVSYVATNGEACVWVSGGLRRCCAQRTHHRICHTSTMPGRYGGGNSGSRGMDAAPPLWQSAAHHRGSGDGRRRPLRPPRAARVAVPPSSPPPGLDTCTASCAFGYALYESHFLSCTAAAQDEQATAPGWRCEVHTPVTTSISAASPSASSAPRLFHSATVVGNRIWLLGGWTAPVGATTLSSTLAALVGTERLVERRRREVRQAVTHGSDSNAMDERLSLAPLAESSLHCTSTSAFNAECKAGNAPSSTSLLWCEGVQSVQCLNDGFPAPPVDAPLPSSQTEDCADKTMATRRWLAAPPRLACHVAVACGDRCVAVFGGLMASTGADDVAPVATSAVHIYDTVQGTWSAQYEHDIEDVHGEWPAARYGHSVTRVPGTSSVRQPDSYFVFGGATTTPSCRTLLVSPEQLLWIWTPVLDVIHRGSSGVVKDVSVQSTWRRVQLPVEFATPLAGRFLSQLHAYSAAEVAAAVCGAVELLESGAAVPSDPGSTSMVLCIAGGMTAPALHKRSAATRDDTPHNTQAAASDAYHAFCECVEPWFSHPALDVTSVLVTCVCERQQQFLSM